MLKGDFFLATLLHHGYDTIPQTCKKVRGMQKDKCLQKLMELTKYADTREAAYIVNQFLDTHKECNCEYTLAEISQVLKITKERVRQIEVSVIKKLRHPKKGQFIKEVLSGFR